MKLHGIEVKTLNREVLAQHLDEFLEMENAWVTLGEAPWNAEQFFQERAKKWDLSSYAAMNGRAIGYTIVSQHNEDSAYLHKILVDEAHQGKGAGFLLLTESIRRCQTLPLKYLCFKSRVNNIKANKLYTSFGCELYDQVRDPDGVQRYLVRADLERLQL